MHVDPHHRPKPKTNGKPRLERGDFIARAARPATAPVIPGPKWKPRYDDAAIDRALEA